MWSSYHKLRCSSEYASAWQSFLTEAVGETGHLIFGQSVGDGIFKSLIKTTFAIIRREAPAERAPTITRKEMNAIRFAAGYVPRALRKKLKKSAKPVKDQLLLCLFDLLDEGDESHAHCQEWVDVVDRGGLTCQRNDISGLCGDEA